MKEATVNERRPRLGCCCEYVPSPAKKFTVKVVYNTYRHGWLYGQVEKTAGRSCVGVSTPGAHNLRFEFWTERGAKNAVRQLRHAFRGYHLRTTLGA